MSFCNRTSKDVPLDLISHSINLFIIPTLCVFGILAATLCIVVFSKRQMRSSLNVYLAGLSSFDLVLLSMSLMIYPALQSCIEQGRMGTPVCHFFWRSALLTYPISLIAQTGSVWTCVAVTVDRFLAVNYPLHSKIWCTPRRALAILCTITLLSIAYRIPSIFELTLSKCGELATTTMRQHPLYISLYITYGYVLVMLMIPWSIMIFFNTFVVLAVHKAYKIRRSMQNIKNQEEKDRRCTIMALVMVLTFIIFNSVAAANNVLEAFQLSLGTKSLRIRIPLGNLLVCLNSASNIVIYSLFGTRFRQMCVVLLCGKNSRCIGWLRTGRVIVSDWDARDAVTRRTSLDASTALISAKSSRRWSKRSSEGRSRRDTVVYLHVPTKMDLQKPVL